MGAITVDADENWRDSEVSRGSAVVLADGLKMRKRDGEDSLTVLQENGRRARSIEDKWYSSERESGCLRYQYAHQDSELLRHEQEMEKL